MTIGTRIKTYRHKLGLSQLELADRLDVKQSTVANYEKNLRMPNIEMAVKLSDVLHVSLDFLLKGVKEDQSLISLSDDFVTLILEHNYEKASQYCQNYYEHNDLESLYFKLFRYALTKIGWLWEVGAITISDEHHASYEIGKLIETFSTAHYNQKKGKVIGMTVPGEKHTHGLKMLLALLNVNYDSHYIGEAVPIDDLQAYIKKERPDYLVLAITSVHFQEKMEDYIESIEVPIMVVGMGTDGYVSKYPHVVGCYRSYEACLEALE